MVLIFVEKFYILQKLEIQVLMYTCMCVFLSVLCCEEFWELASHRTTAILTSHDTVHLHISPLDCLARL